MQFPDLDDAMVRPYAYSPGEHVRAAARREQARVAREAAEAERVEAEQRKRAQDALNALRARNQGG